MEEIDKEINGNDISDEKSNQKRIMDFLIWLIIAVVLALSAFFFTRNFIMRWPIVGPSMIPTLQDDDSVLLFKTQKVNYDDVIIFLSDLTNSNGDRKHLVKRIIGKEGDEIKTIFDTEKNCFRIYRNGELLPEEKTNEPMFATGGWREQTVIVPKGCYYVLGDNRNNSTDSGEGIYAHKGDVVGIVFLRMGSTGSIEIVN